MIEKSAWKKVFVSDLPYVVEELKEEIDIPAVIILSGPVGAGKTTFVKSFVDGQLAQSPSYSLINEGGHFAHADFYRITNHEEIIHLEMGLYLEEKDYFLIEWGMPYIKTIKKEIGEQFKYYQLEIKINELMNSIDDMPSRNYLLSDLGNF